MASAFADRIAERSGAIVNVASVLAWMPVGASYGVSKAAMWSATDSMRLELAPRGVQVVGVYVGLVDTDMAKFTDSPKSDPADVVRQVLDGIESGADEVLADEMTRGVRAQLSKPIHARSGAWQLEMMRAFTIDRYKSKDGGQIVEVPQPEVGDNDVLVQIHAAGVNLLDAKIASW